MSAQMFSAAIAKVQTLVLPLQGQFTASVTSKVRYRVPQRCRLVRIGTSARAKGGTHGVTTIDVKVDGASVLSAAMDLAGADAGDFVEGAIAAAKVVVAKEGEITVDLTQTGGSSPTTDDITVQVDYLPED